MLRDFLSDSFLHGTCDARIERFGVIGVISRFSSQQRTRQRRGQNREPSLEEETSQICSKVKVGLQNLQVSLAWRVARVGQRKLTGSTKRIRWFKYDEARPSCLKCRSMGRTCDSFDIVPHCVEAGVTTTQHHHNGTIVAASCGLFDSCATVNVQRVPSPYCHDYHSLTLRNLRPSMMLPAIAPTQTEAMSFFELISVKHLNEYYPSESWRKTLMLILQTVPSVRHAAIALALLHRDYHNCCSTVPEHEPLLHYNKAIQLVLAQKSDDSIEQMA